MNPGTAPQCERPLPSTNPPPRPQLASGYTSRAGTLDLEDSCVSGDKQLLVVSLFPRCGVGGSRLDDR